MDVLVASDLVGCRYRLHQRRQYPEAPTVAQAAARQVRRAAARDTVHNLFPVKADSRRTPFRRIDLGPLPADDPWARSMDTMEAIAAGFTHIEGAVFTGHDAGHDWEVGVDLVLREGDSYTPVIVSQHRVARKDDRQTATAVPTHRLGLSQPLTLHYKLRHHPIDGYRLGLAARGLQELGVDSGRGALIGQDRSLAFFWDTDHFQPALQRALETPTPDRPRRVKECATCRFWPRCQEELVKRDDISLFLPGDRAKAYRDDGIDTVQGLIDANRGEASTLAAAWRDGTVLLRRGDVTMPRADVEVDVDMEAYLDQGAYLWGAWHDGTYHPFVTWEPLGGRAEADNFARFWTWLMNLRAAAHADGKTFAAYCYSAHGENHWMRMSAQRFGRPTLDDVTAFIASDEWVDVFAHVKRQLAGPYGLGLKTVAPQAGFEWRQDDFDGEESVNARRAALAGDEAVRQQLLTYNCDDVRATAAVRDWLSAGAPGAPLLQPSASKPTTGP